jgi:hypothetical protein
MTRGSPAESGEKSVSFHGCGQGIINAIPFQVKDRRFFPPVPDKGAVIPHEVRNLNPKSFIG